MNANLVFDPPPISYFTSNNLRYAIHYCLKSGYMQHAYQLLRAEWFVHRLHWDIHLDPEGRERDQYDDCAAPTAHVSIHAISSDTTHHKHILAGVRVFRLDSWLDSMLMNEFLPAGMVPGHIQRFLQDHYDPRQFLELTRFCVRPKHWSHFEGQSYNNQIARDLCYSAVYAQAFREKRPFALALASSDYLKIMCRFSRFSVQVLYASQTYAVVIIDLWQTIDSIIASGNMERAQRMLFLCKSLYAV